MGVFKFLFKGDCSDEEGWLSGVKEKCEVCEEEFIPEELYEDGMCSRCAELSGGPKYCCGVIYENDESVCASCGEPL